MNISAIPLWGQAWELTVVYATEGGARTLTISYVDWSHEALRITFDVLQAMNSSPFWYADISVYNLNEQSVQNLLLNATWVTLKAGFQTGPSLYSIIWDGPVFQTLFTREDVKDQKITFHCVANPFVMDTIVNFAVGPFSSQAQLAAKLASEISLPTISTAQGTLGATAAQRMSNTQYPRGKTVYGKVGKFLTQIANSNFLQFWQDGQQAYLSEVDNGNRSPDYVFSPPFPPGYTPQMLGIPNATTQSLVGTPEQTPEGVIFKVLLDPRLKVTLPPQLVRIVRSQVNQLTRTPNPNSTLVGALSSDLTFFVSQLRHTGDSRGNDWHTEVTGWSTAYAETLLDLYPALS